MPGRDYTRAFALFRDTLDDGYYGERHLHRYSFGASSSLGTLPGDLWMQNLVDNEKKTEHIWQQHRDGPIAVAKKSLPSLEHQETTDLTGNLYTVAPRRTLQTRKSKTHPEYAQLSMPESTPSSSAEQFRTEPNDGGVTPMPASFRRQRARHEAMGNTRDASEETFHGHNTREGLLTIASPEVKSGIVEGYPRTQLSMASPWQEMQSADAQTSREAVLEEEDQIPLLARLGHDEVSTDDGRQITPRDNVSNSDLRSRQDSSVDVQQSIMRSGSVRPSTPHNSQVIAALVVDTTPPQRKRKLRHAIKDLDLRDTASQGGHSNRTSYSDASVLVSKAPNEERLSAQLQAVPSLESDRSGSAGSRTLRSVGKLRSPSPSAMAMSDAKDEQGSPVAPDAEPQSALIARPKDEADSQSSRVQQLGRQSLDAPKRTTRTPVPSVLSPELIRDLSLPKHTRHFSAISSISFDDRKSSRGSDMVGLGISSNLSPVGMPYHSRKGSHQSSIFHSRLRRPSDNASISSSLASPRSYHLRSPSSPISFNSEGNYTPNLVEATAINLYPHHNTSVLLVQQQGVPRPQPVMSTPTHSRPTITLDMPQNEFDMEDDVYIIRSNDSHIQKRQTPPSFTIIPPTPGDERASGMLVSQEPIEQHEQADDHSTPRRHTSLLKRAREYSNNTIQPFMSRTFSNAGSVQRTATRRRRLFDTGARLSRSQAADPADMAENADHKLHPFWQPRDFWNDVEEEAHEHTEEDYRQTGQPEYPLHAQDTTNKHEQPPISWRGGGSLRFLIGNSLGIDRQPTNRRLPMVRWPSKRMTEKKERRSRVFMHGHTLRTVRSVTMLGRMRQSLVGGGQRARKSSRRSRKRWKKGLRCGLGQ